MKKVIILSYFYPPANFVACQRTSFWAKNLNQNGIYPIIITRCWNENQTDVSSPGKRNYYSVENHENYEVHRQPVKKNFRDITLKYKFLLLVQKALTFWELFWGNFFISALPYSNFYDFSKNLIKNDNEIIGIIASGRPFETFHIGYSLKKQFPDLLWIPDYRDEWNTNINYKPKNILQQILNYLSSKKELKWTSNADFFISVSSSLVKSIHSFNNIRGEEVLNGYEKIRSPRQNISKDLLLIYSGTLYPFQDIHIIIEAIKAVNKTITNSIQLFFIGIDTIEDEQNKVIELIENDHNFKVIERIDKTTLDKYIDKCDILFLTSYQHNKGWYPVKLFDYFSIGKPILLCPSDNSTMERFIIETNSGEVVDNLENCKIILKKWADLKKQNINIEIDRKMEVGK